ncbi:hypothetical protein PGB90_003563 [Kerria lacca]
MAWLSNVNVRPSSHRPRSFEQHRLVRQLNSYRVRVNDETRGKTADSFAIQKLRCQELNLY